MVGNQYDKDKEPAIWKARAKHLNHIQVVNNYQVDKCWEQGKEDYCQNAPEIIVSKIPKPVRKNHPISGSSYNQEKTRQIQ